MYTSRIFHNQEALIASLRSALANETDAIAAPLSRSAGEAEAKDGGGERESRPEISLTVVDLAKISLREQIAVMSSASVVIGMHGVLCCGVLCCIVLCCVVLLWCVV